MNKTGVSCFTVAWLLGGLAYAQAPAPAPAVAEYTVKVTSQELDLIAEGLQSQPFGKVLPLINKLRQQVVEQQQAAAKPVAPVEPPKP